MKEKLKIDYITSSDQIEECMRITTEAWQGIPEIEQIPSHIMKASMRTGQFLVASLDEKIIGYSMSFSHVPDKLYLHAIGVSAKFQSQGIGGKIMTKMKELARKEGFSSIGLTYAPLLGQNARLYIHKMLGTCSIYEPDAYNKTYNDSTGGAAPADRLFVDIDLTLEYENTNFNLLETQTMAINEIEETKSGIKTRITKQPGRLFAVHIPHSMEEVKSFGPVAEINTVLDYRALFEFALSRGKIIDFLTFKEQELHQNFYILSHK